MPYNLYRAGLNERFEIRKDVFAHQPEFPCRFRSEKAERPLGFHTEFAVAVVYGPFHDRLALTGSFKDFSLGHDRRFGEHGLDVLHGDGGGENDLFEKINRRPAHGFVKDRGQDAPVDDIFPSAEVQGNVEF